MIGLWRSLLLVRFDLRLMLGDDLVGDVGGHLLVALELHLEGAAPLRHAAELGRVLVHFRHRDLGVDHLQTFVGGHAEHAAALVVEVARDVAHVGVGDADEHLHDRLEQHRLGLGDRFAEGHASGDLERHFVGVDRVVLAVVDRDAHVFDRTADQRPGGEHVCDALFDRRDEVLGNGPADDFVGELVPFLARSDPQIDLGELPGAAGLLLVAVVAFAGSGDRLAVGDLGRAEHRLDLELILEPLGHDRQMLVAHAREQEFVGFVVAFQTHGRVALDDLMQTGRDLFVLARFRCRDRVGHDAVREFDPRQGLRRSAARQGVAELGALEFGDGEDAPRTSLGRRSLVLAVHEKQLTEALLRAVADVVDFAVGLEDARDRPHEGELAAEGVVDALEDQTVGVARLGDHDVAALGGDVFQRRREDVDDAVEKLLNADVLLRADREDRDRAAADDAGAETLLDLLLGELFTLEVALHQRFVGLGDRIPPRCHQLLLVHHIYDQLHRWSHSMYLVGFYHKQCCL